MDEKVKDDDLYSLIFQSLRHPIRRRILRMLKNDSLTFSRILNNLSIDSGHLSYHLEGLGELLIKNDDGFYSLSSIGVAAIRLMSGVEEETTITIESNNKIKTLKKLALLLICLLIFISVPTSLYFIGYTENIGRASWNGSSNIVGNGTLHYGITFNYGFQDYEVGNKHIKYSTDAPIKNLNFWEEDILVTEINLKAGGVIKVRIHFPNGEFIDESFISDSGGGGSVSSSESLMVGLTTFELISVKSEAVDAGELRVSLQRNSYSKPYFYHGTFLILIIILTILLIYYYKLM